MRCSVEKVRDDSLIRDRGSDLLLNGRNESLTKGIVFEWAQLVTVL